jgi:hypothetical protein
VAQRLSITTTAAQRAATLDRQMRALGLADPYQPVHAPPADYGKLRRHKHPRYCFDPLDPKSEEQKGITFSGKHRPPEIV